MFRHPRLYTLIVMVLAAVAVGTVLLNLHGAGPVPLPPAAITLQAPALLYNSDAFYEEQAPPPTPPAPVVKPHPRRQGEPVRIAIIIDDVGLSRTQTLPVIDLPPAIALAFLPYGEHVNDLAMRAHAAGHPIMLHMPMLPKGGQNPGPDALSPGLDAAIVRARVTAALDRIPYVIGMNNHMGSAATADPALMNTVMAVVKERPLFFVDSYTSPQSVAFPEAQAAGIPSARRDVFLDNDPASGAIDQQLHRLEALADAHGSAIAIGHPYPTTLAALHDWLARDGGLDNRGIKLISIQELMEKTQ